MRTYKKRTQTTTAKTQKIVCVQHQRICEILVAKRTGTSVTKKQSKKCSWFYQGKLLF